MNDIERTLIPIFPHPSIIEDLGLIPIPSDLHRWLEVYDAGDETKKAANEALKNDGGWETIRLAIELYELDCDGKYSDLYRQVVFRSLGTDKKNIDAESVRTKSGSRSKR
jgi:hypothetical protein